VGRSFAHLHEPALAMAAMFFRIEPALTPDDRFHQHGIQLMFGGNGANQAIVLLKSRRAHPFVKRINRIPRYHCEVSKACSECQHSAKDQFEKESYHFGIKSR